MKTVAQLISDLQKFPQDARCYAYEGEVIGVVVAERTEAGYLKQLGYIIATSDNEIDTEVNFEVIV